MNTQISKLLAHGLVAMIFGAGLVGCGVSDEVTSTAGATNYSKQGLTLGAVLEVQGSYGANCVQRSGSWSVALSGFTGSANAALSVVKRNVNCSLTLTALRIGTELDNTVYTATSGLALGSAYLASSHAFHDGNDALGFYANAKLSSTSYAADFSIDIGYSDNPVDLTANKLSQYAVVSSSASTSQVAPPNYELDLTGISIQVDADDVVDSTSGSAALGNETVAGQQYVIVNSDLGATPSYESVDTAFLGGTPSAIAATIGVAEFSLDGQDLTDGVARTLIISHEVDNVRSYQIFRITFNAPAP